MNERKKFIYTLGIILSVFCLWIGFFIFPKFTGWQALNKDMDLYQIKIASRRALILNNDRIEKNLNRLNQQVTDMRKRLIPYSDKNAIADIIRNTFREYNITVLNVSPVLSSYLSVNNREHETGVTFKRLPIETELSANFMDFAQLLRNTDKLPFYLVPDQLLISKSELNNGKLYINFKVSVFISTGG